MLDLLTQHVLFAAGLLLVHAVLQLGEHVLEVFGLVLGRRDCLLQFDFLRCEVFELLEVGFARLLRLGLQLVDLLPQLVLSVVLVCLVQR